MIKRPQVFDLAADLDKAVEIDAYPDRQDLNVGLLKLARKAGCRISLGTDSHGPSQLAFIELGGHQRPDEPEISPRLSLPGRSS